ncbi:glycerol-3-phosphate responsive antiterminator [Clostridium akagii]|uniref:glycerol-3-phosphate responsive antiterminator n=1 Tax=Clostridium akagii TaxID=91623 RepID=UPI00047DDCE0|nr:glycerol-3-phosphate responsive antiterminator [Clostridium akagii]
MDAFSFEQLLIENPVVGAIRNDDDLQKINISKIKIVFILYGSITSVKDICSSLKKAGKVVFVHVDMIDGLKNDQKGIEFIKEQVEPFGIITTRQNNIKHAHNLGLYTIQRIFVIDSLSLITGIKNIHAVSPNAVEVMPGIASKIIRSLEKEIHLPIIAGGLISTKKEIMESISSGAMAVSTTAHELWDLDN